MSRMEMADSMADYIIDSSSSTSSTIDGKIFRYERFVEEVLKTDLQKVSHQYEEICEQIANYNNVKSTIETINRHELKTIKTMNDIGSNCYVQCVIPNTDRIYLCVGLDCFVELTLDEALKFIDRKTGILKKSMELLAENSAKIKAHIKIVLNLIDQLKNGGGDNDSC
ncbi:uxt prefoldin-like subunit [Dermatophagoides farinae]|uniref:uxt prefoldin-like subunit n=1 Tax=Dermatophagoides farinae TaxID=6954 RepID=UPI003F6294B3